MLLSSSQQENIILIINQIIFLFTLTKNPTILLLPVTNNKLPKIISKRVLDFSCDENEFTNTKVIYESALKQWFNSTMKFHL